MGNIIEYALKSGISLTVLYLFYWLVLKKDTHFAVNRMVLMISAIISLVIPSLAPILIQSPVIEDLPLVIDFSSVGEDKTNFQESGFSAAVASDPVWSVGKILIIIYIMGAFIVIARLIYQAIYLHAVSRLSKKSRYDGFTFVSLDTDMVPFSYFNRIFIPAGRIEEDALDSIIAHEKSHLSQGHYIDLFIVQIVTVLQWFNPFVWLFEKSIKEVHEYLADEAVLNEGKNPGKYQAILVNQALGGPVFILTNQFNQSLIKKRILMMKNVKTSWAAQFKALLILPLIAGLLLAFANPPQISQADNADGEGITVTGSVSDKVTGKLLEGAMVIIRGTTTGTVTDKNGNYSIVVAGTGDELAVSHLSYESQIVRVGNNTKINVQLDQYVLDLDFSKGNQLNIEENPPNTNQSSKKSNEDKTYVFVEELPGYPGGTDALHQFLMSNLKYPQNDKNKGIQGTVLTTFVIDARGNVTSAKILRGVSPEMDLEALRITNLMKGWKPATQNGQPVSMPLTMPIEFKIKQ